MNIDKLIAEAYSGSKSRAGRFFLYKKAKYWLLPEFNSVFFFAFY